MSDNFEGRTYEIVRSELFEVWSSSDPSERNEQVFQYVVSKFNLLNSAKEELQLIRQGVARFSSQVRSKWDSAGHPSRKDRFAMKNGEWLDQHEVFGEVPADSDQDELHTTPLRRGRPQKSFDECGIATKRARVHELVENISPNELRFAAEMATRASGSRVTAQALKAVSESPEEAKRIVAAKEELDKQQIMTELSKMSTESLSTSKNSSRTASTRCVTPDSPDTGADSPNSGSDSLNSLLGRGDGVTARECGGGVECAGSVVECTKGCDVTCEDEKGRREGVCCNSVGQCVWGVLLLALSVGSLIFTPLDFMLWEKLNMRPGFPPYEWWVSPPDEVRLRVRVFNVTNHERFMSGLDHKLGVQEIGPVVYLEKLLHYNVRRNDNSTMTYTAKRFPIFLPDENTVDLNATIWVPNLAVLGISSFLHNAPYLVRAGFRLLVNSHGSEFFIKKTIYEYLWDYQESVLETSKNLAPGLVPVNNMGMLARIYADFEDEVTVRVGPEWGHQDFFQIDRFRGQPQLPGYDAEACPDRIFGSTEGVMYRQRVSKTDVLLYWRKTVCKLMPLYFDQELTIDDAPLYRFNLSESVFDRVTNSTDCYNTEPTLPAGVSDASKCYFDFPMVVSYPHFYTGAPPPDTFVTGLKPDRYKHNSYIVVEPLTGTPFRSVARMQSNLRVHDLSGFSKEYDKFSNMIIPLFWAEYNQEGLPHHIRSTLYFMVVILPPLSTTIFAVLLIFGCYLIGKQIYIHKLRSDSLSSVLPFKNNAANALASTKLFTFEQERFLRKT